MGREEIIIRGYLTIEAAYQAVAQGRVIRQCGRAPGLTDAEAITLEVFGEMQGLHNDAAIWCHANAHWRGWFPALGSHKAYVKQCANLERIKQRIFAHLYAPQDDVHITDGVSMPICHLARVRHNKLFRGEAAFGFCAAKDEYYCGFKGHVVTSLHQRVVGFTLAPANIDERDVLGNLCGSLSGLVIGDKGLLSKAKQAGLVEAGIGLQPPVRGNMHDPRPKATVQRLMKVRRRIETAIGQLVGFFGFSACKARAMWHLSSRLVRKILAYNLAIG